MKLLFSSCVAMLLLLCTESAEAQDGPRRMRHRRMAFATDTVMTHDPVMARERDMYYLLSQ